MQWILQDFEDTHKLAAALKRHGAAFSFHKVVPFIGTLEPAPVIADPKRTILFGSYTLWRYAEAAGLQPGVFRIQPFIDQTPWLPDLLNGADGRFIVLQDIPAQIEADDRAWFIRPKDDSKEIAGKVLSGADIVNLARGVVALDKADIPKGSLRHDSEMMLFTPKRIKAEWRLWVVGGKVVTWSLYKQGTRVLYKPEIDDDALAFGQSLAARHPTYSPAYVMDICRTDAGLRMIETNCINAAGLYAADLDALITALETQT
ncbi:ATP-grasp domain-containing protein [Roseobacteraceae bacterium S113]